MRIILSTSTQEAVATVVTHILDKISSHPSSVIGLATGRTMEPVYDLWVKTAIEQKLDLDKCFFFMLDEYLGISQDHPSSFKSYIDKRLIQPLGLHYDQFAFPPVQLVKEGRAGEHYEELIQQASGIDLQLLGLGVNGHIGFNEPGTSFESTVHVVRLKEETRQDNARFFDSIEEVPNFAITMGIKDILRAKKILLIASGQNKAMAIKEMLEGKIREEVPCTILQNHPDVVVVLDKAAASLIKHD
jgi:glucosamine-6-phosphate deaminase